MKQKAGSSKNINKIDKPLAIWLGRGKRCKLIKLDDKEVSQQIPWNPEDRKFKMDKFLDTFDLAKLNQDVTTT
jgi:hypothetical protein